jgi:hypothetical protein
MRTSLLPILICALPLLAQKYSGPRPEKSDLPYIVHANNLVPAEAAEAKQEEHKNEVTYVISGAHSTARTPLAMPTFLILADQIEPQRLQLYKLESKGDQREVLFSRKKKQVARPIMVNVTRLDDNLYRLEVVDSLDDGEYSLTPEGSNQVFCFAVY